MFLNVGGPEILVIAMVALIAVGPDQLPGLIRRLGQMAAEARAVTSNLRSEFMAGIDEIAESVEEAKSEVEGSWLGTGSDDDPVVPRGYAEKERQRAAELDADLDAQEASVGAAAGGRLGRDDGAADDPTSNGSGGGRLGRSDDPASNDPASDDSRRADPVGDSNGSPAPVDEPMAVADDVVSEAGTAVADDPVVESSAAAPDAVGDDPSPGATAEPAGEGRERNGDGEL